MKWHFQPRPEGDEEERDDDDSAPSLFGLPAALLERHGARVLNPGHAGEVGGYPTPRPTVYRARTLLVPDDLLGDDDFIATVNEVLRHTGMKLVAPREGRDADVDRDADLDTDRADQQVFEALRQLPRPAVLIPREGYRRPVVIDAWTALQTLRAATAREQVLDEAPAAPERLTDSERLTDPERVTESERVTLDKAKVDRIELEHLLIGSIITGDPITGGHGAITGGPGNGSDASGPSATNSYLFSGGDPRTPVAVILDPPRRTSAEYCTSHYGRRPVVAVLDTGARAHPWLDVTTEENAAAAEPPDAFVAIDVKIQDAIHQESQRAEADGDKQRRVLEDAWDQPIADNPLIGELNDALGHCTFIAGIVRQVAPDARVLAVRVTSSDNILYEGDIICGLRHLAKRIALAEPDDLAAQVDVVSLSFGFYSESRHDRMKVSGLWRAIELLLLLGVVVVASAGNDATSRRCYPAAFALEPVPGHVPVISVGALNLNGTKAMFSNDGRWVTAWAPGACVVSTYPTDVDGSRTPELRIPVDRQPPGTWATGREALDPDDYSAGFALWSGTSFSAPYAAALVCRSLLAGAARSGAGLKLDNLGTDEKRRRAVAAYEDLPRDIP
jgi:hypothetical protein